WALGRSARSGTPAHVRARQRREHGVPRLAVWACLLGLGLVVPARPALPLPRMPAPLAHACRYGILEHAFAESPRHRVHLPVWPRQDERLFRSALRRRIGALDLFRQFLG